MSSVENAIQEALAMGQDLMEKSLEEEKIRKLQDSRIACFFVDTSNLLQFLKTAQFYLREESAALQFGSNSGEQVDLTAQKKILSRFLKQSGKEPNTNTFIEVSGTNLLQLRKIIPPNVSVHNSPEYIAEHAFAKGFLNDLESSYLSVPDKYKAARRFDGARNFLDKFKKHKK